MADEMANERTLANANIDNEVKLSGSSQTAENGFVRPDLRSLSSRKGGRGNGGEAADRKA